MASLELSDSEIALLRMVVNWRLGGLAVEINHTDSREFRNMLREQRDTLEGIAQKLEAMITAGA